MSKNLLMILTFLASSYVSYAGGGWVHTKGKGFFKLNEWRLTANQYYARDGNVVPNITSGLFNTSLYGEYGITDKINLIANIPILSRAFVEADVSAIGNIISEMETLNTVGDTDVGIKYGLIRNKPVVMSATLMLGLPLGKTSQGNQGRLATGDGEFNQYLSLQVSTSKSFGKLNTFYSLDLGINNRTKGFSDEFRAGIEVGAIYDKKVIFIYRVRTVKSFNNSSFVEMNGATLFASDVEFVSPTIELGYEIKEKYGISASVGSAFSGRLIYANKSYSVGVYMKL